MPTTAMTQDITRRRPPRRVLIRIGSPARTPCAPPVRRRRAGRRHAADLIIVPLPSGRRAEAVSKLSGEGECRWYGRREPAERKVSGWRYRGGVGADTNARLGGSAARRLGGSADHCNNPFPCRRQGPRRRLHGAPFPIRRRSASPVHYHSGEVVRARYDLRAHLEEVAARGGGLGLVLDRVCKRGFHHRLRGVGPLDRSPFVTARTASRKSGIGAGQAGKNVVKSVRWCRSPRTRCPRSQGGSRCLSRSHSCNTTALQRMPGGS